MVWGQPGRLRPGAVAAAVTRAGAHGCTGSVVRRWLMHAGALTAGLPAVRTDAKWPVSGPYIAPDLEYVVSPGADHIWLVGAALAEGESTEHRHWWAGSADEVPSPARRLAGMLEESPGLTVVTRGGAVGRPAAARCGVLAVRQADADRPDRGTAR